LTPSAPRTDLAWQPWESLGAERLVLAELLLRAGRYAESLRVASAFDSPQPVISLLYLPASLRVRERAADALRRPELVSRFRDRLRRLNAARGPVPLAQANLHREEEVHGKH